MNGVAAGVFHNLHRFPTRTVSLDYLSTHDGSSTTLMLSENVQATEWAVRNDLSDANDNFTHLTPWQAETTIVWWRTFVNNNFSPTTCIPPTNLGGVDYSTKIGINAARDDTGSVPAGNIIPVDMTSLNGWTTDQNPAAFLAYARPSARHPGGVLMTFCDGHSQFFSETLDYGVYQGIMTPYGRQYGLGVLDASVLGSP
jgi:prepilin-type processing-associated H-X9-DG protein